MSFIIENGQVVESELQEMADSFAAETTTPYGVGRRDFTVEETVFLVGEKEFGTFFDADQYFQSVDWEEGEEVPAIEEKTQWLCQSYGPGGSRARIVKTVETEDEADEWLDACAVFDFEHDCNAPTVFKTREAAEKFLIENAE